MASVNSTLLMLKCLLLVEAEILFQLSADRLSLSLRARTFHHDQRPEFIWKKENPARQPIAALICF